MAALRASLPIRVALPRLERVLALNVEKEVRKDALVVRCAGKHLRPDAVEALLAEARDLDREFLARVSAFPVAIVIPYENIAPLRRQRIEHLLAAARRILAAWPLRGGVSAAVMACWTQAEFEQVLREHLSLYASETRALAAQVRLPAVLAPLRESLADRLHRLMRKAALDLAGDAARRVYRGPRRCTAQNRASN